MNPCHDLDESGFSSTVFTDQGVNFTFSEVEPAVIQRMDTRKSFVDVCHFKNDMLLYFRHFYHLLSCEYGLRYGG